jgi:hypothetical protein
LRDHHVLHLCIARRQEGNQQMLWTLQNGYLPDAHLREVREIIAGK